MRYNNTKYMHGQYQYVWDTPSEGIGLEKSVMEGKYCNHSSA